MARLAASVYNNIRVEGGSISRRFTAGNGRSPEGGRGMSRTKGDRTRVPSGGSHEGAESGVAPRGVNAVKEPTGPQGRPRGRMRSGGRVDDPSLGTSAPHGENLDRSGTQWLALPPQGEGVGRVRHARVSWRDSRREGGTRAEGLKNPLAEGWLRETRNFEPSK